MIRGLETEEGCYKVRVTFVYRPAKGKIPEKVCVAGDFNRWNFSGKEYEMKREAERVWRLDLNLPPGRYQFKLVRDGFFIKNMESIQQELEPFIREYSNDNFCGKNAVLEIK